MRFECSICLSELIIDLETRVTPCNHLFHPECLGDWMRRHATSACPKCRVVLTEENVSTLFLDEYTGDGSTEATNVSVGASAGGRANSPTQQQETYHDMLRRMTDLEERVNVVEHRMALRSENPGSSGGGHSEASTGSSTGGEHDAGASLARSDSIENLFVSGNPVAGPGNVDGGSAGDRRSTPTVMDLVDDDPMDATGQSPSISVQATERGQVSSSAVQIQNGGQVSSSAVQIQNGGQVSSSAVQIQNGGQVSSSAVQIQNGGQVSIGNVQEVEAANPLSPPSISSDDLLARLVKVFVERFPDLGRIPMLKCVDVVEILGITRSDLVRCVLEYEDVFKVTDHRVKRRRSGARRTRQSSMDGLVGAELMSDENFDHACLELQQTLSVCSRFVDNASGGCHGNCQDFHLCRRYVENRRCTPTGGCPLGHLEELFTPHNNRAIRVALGIRPAYIPIEVREQFVKLVCARGRH